MRYPKLREIREAVKSLFTKPYTTKFPKEPHKPFLSFRGRPYYYEEKCIGCTACVNVCPTGALCFRDVVDKNKAERILEIQLDICIECGQCQLNCPTSEGIKLSVEFDISTTENRKLLRQSITKEMVICEYCSEPIAPKEQIIWVIKKIGPLYTSNTTLIAFEQSMLEVRDNIPKNKDIKFSHRSDRFLVLCPHCRRKVVYTS